MEVGMSQGQIKCLHKLFKECLKDKRPITLSSHLDIWGVWEHTSAQLTPVSLGIVLKFEYKTISVLYGGIDHEFMVPHRPLWNWVTDLILDMWLAPHFEWDAWEVFRHNGENTTHVYDEPWTANMFWDFQVHTFFSLMVLVVGALLNGGQLLRDLQHTLCDQSLIELSKTGCWLNGVNGKPNLYYPAITMLSANYEEQYIMALNQGTGGKWLCPNVFWLVDNSDPYYGAKYKDISKVVVFVAQNIIPWDNQEGQQLLLCLRSFSFLDLLLSFKVHTEQTILAG
ncbi:hypothetical protein EI94DRAFT_1696135 [Lactarius quietus]|nr:hypothetical protein EI94DRAFT_1696135 [Lactarius quietus]